MYLSQPRGWEARPVDLGLRALMRGHHCLGWYLRKDTCGLILGVLKVTGH